MKMFLPGLNEHFRTIGKKKLPKKSFKDQASAEYFIQNTIKDDLAISYLCTVCGKWHVGHKK